MDYWRNGNLPGRQISEAKYIGIAVELVFMGRPVWGAFSLAALSRVPYDADSDGRPSARFHQFDLPSGGHG